MHLLVKNTQSSSLVAIFRSTSPTGNVGEGMNCVSRLGETEHKDYVKLSATWPTSLARKNKNETAHFYSPRQVDVNRCIQGLPRTMSGITGGGVVC